MKANPFSLDAVLGQRHQWVVPVYQRHYEWETGEDKQLPKLWDDLREEALERLDGTTPLPHYFGAIIYSEPQNQTFGAVPLRHLVDGQQRITTFHLVLAAIKEVARVHNAQRLVVAIDAYVLNEKTASMVDPSRERFKLWPSAYDRALFQDIVENARDGLRQTQSRFFYKNGKLITGSAPNLLRAYWYLLEALESFIQERIRDNAESPDHVLDAVLGGFLTGFQIVVIQLDPNDDAQEIFASLNGLGKPLSPFDLIRNDVFHRARKGREDEERLFDSRWKMFERPFWSEQVRQGRLKRARADHLIGHSVVAETARDVNMGKIAVEYQRYSRERSYPTVGEELDVLLKHATTYAAMEDGKAEGPLGRIAKLLRLWDLSTFHPLILRVNAGSGDDDTKAQLYALVESYIVRRELCGLTTKNYNKVVSGMIRQLLDADGIGPFVDHLKNLTGEASRMPSDLELTEAIIRRPLYGQIPTPRLNYILRGIEVGSRNKFDEAIAFEGHLTIEHIMPQKWAKNWPLPNGISAQFESVFAAPNEYDDDTKRLMDARNRAVNTLGNLSLLNEALNPSVGNSAWSNKREKFQRSLLALNRSIADTEKWDENAISARAATLATIVTRLWSEP